MLIWQPAYAPSITPKPNLNRIYTTYKVTFDSITVFDTFDSSIFATKSDSGEWYLHATVGDLSTGIDLILPWDPAFPFGVNKGTYQFNGKSVSFPIPQSTSSFPISIYGYEVDGPLPDVNTYTCPFSCDSDDKPLGYMKYNFDRQRNFGEGVHCDRSYAYGTGLPGNYSVCFHITKE